MKSLSLIIRIFQSGPSWGWKDDSGLRALSALLEDPDAVPSTSTWCLTTTDSSSFMGSNALFWPPGAPGTHMVPIHTCRKKNIHTHKITRSILKIWSGSSFPAVGIEVSSVRERQSEDCVCHCWLWRLRKEKKPQGAAASGTTFLPRILRTDAVLSDPCTLSTPRPVYVCALMP